MSSFDSPRRLAGSSPLIGGEEPQQTQLNSPPTPSRGQSWNYNTEPWTPSKVNGEESNTSPSALSEEKVPPLYQRLFQAAEPEADGTISLDKLRIILNAGNVKAASSEKIVTLIAKSKRITKQEFYVALALLALAQYHRELSIEAVSAARESLPIPTLPTSMTSGDSLTLNASSSSTLSTPVPITPAPPYRPVRSSSDMSVGDAWGTSNSGGGSRSYVAPPSAFSQRPVFEASETGPGFVVSETETNGNEGFAYGEEGWALGRQERVEIDMRDELAGYILKHTMWYVRAEKTGLTVERRYSDFVWLLDCLVKRYPFRLLPSLPPKRVAISGRHIAADDLFLERRRRGLERFLNFLVNHPVLRYDGLLNTFLTETSNLSLWRKNTPLSLEEESTSRILTSTEEMTIPGDLESRLAELKGRIVHLIEHWTRITSTFDRIAHRRQNQAADWSRLKGALDGALDTERSGWRAEEVRTVEADEETMANFAQKIGDVVRSSATRCLETTVEDIKRHRELYVNFRELFSRQTTLGPDASEKLKKRVETNMKKLEVMRGQTTPPASQADLEKIVSSIESDQRGISSLLHRRSFIRYCMWQELVYLWRSTSLLSGCIRDLAKDEITFMNRGRDIWDTFGETLGVSV